MSISNVVATLPDESMALSQGSGSSACQRCGLPVCIGKREVQKRQRINSRDISTATPGTTRTSTITTITSTETTAQAYSTGLQYSRVCF